MFPEAWGLRRLKSTSGLATHPRTEWTGSGFRITHTLLWARSAPERLSAEALAVLQSAESILHVSMASLWECAIKSSIGKLAVPDGFYRIVSSGYEVLGIEVAHVEACAALPLHHRDPFDRLLVAQARLGGLILVSRDRNIARYGIPTVVA